MAEVIARQLEKRHGGGVEFSSAGTHAVIGSGATAQAVAVVGELGMALRWHRARQLTDQIVTAADKLVALDHQHVEFIEMHYPAAPVELLDSVPDPYGLDVGSYRAVRDQIAVAIGERAGRWLG